MKQIFKPAVLIATMVVVLASCKKEESPDPSNNAGNNTTIIPAPTKTQLLTAKTWKLNAATISPAYMGMSDMYSMMNSCEKDNTLKFNATTKMATTDEGATKCDAMAPQTKNESWAFSNNESMLTIGASTYGITELSSGVLKVTTTIKMDMSNYTLTETFSAQ